MGNRVKSSKWWEFFQPASDDASKPKCTLCSTDDKGLLTSWNSSNAKSHMKNHHKQEFDEIEAKEQQEHKSSSAKKRKLSPPQKSIKDVFAPVTEEQTARQDLLCSLVLSKPTHSLSLFGDPAMMKFLQQYNSRIPIPKSAHGATLAIERTAKKVVKKLKSDFQNWPHISATADIWTDSAHGIYLGMTLHKLDSNFQPISRFVGLRQLRKDETAISIRDETSALLETIGLDIDSIDFIVTDNASNMICAFKKDLRDLTTTEVNSNSDLDETDESMSELTEDEAENGEGSINQVIELDWKEGKRISCIDHTLVLALKDTLKSSKCKRYRSLMQRVRKIVKSIRKSSQLKARMYELSGKSLLMPGQTRWIGNVIMNKRFIELFVHVNTICDEKQLPKIKLQELKDLEELTNLLNPVLDAIIDLQGEKYITVSRVYGTLQSLKYLAIETQNRGGYAKDVATVLLDQIEYRFGKFVGNSSDTNPHFILCALLDPSQAFLLQDIDPNLLFSWLLGTVTVQVNSILENGEEIEAEVPQTPFEKLMYDKALKRNQANKERLATEKAVRDYIDSVLAKKGQNASTYWAGRGKIEHPLIKDTAMKYLTCPATSAPIERLFSLAGLATRGIKNRTQFSTLNNRLLNYANQDYFIES